MTTDLVPKFLSKEVKLSGGEVRITGACKGSGMIHPNMATMLGFVLTDAKLDANTVAAEAKRCADASFNMISVDGETSTNDTLLLLANGASGVSLTKESDKKLFAETLLDVFVSLAKLIAQDGEGATKLITVTVKNASSLEEARAAARMITTSPLIKSAIHGEDPNWGRILSRLGQAGVKAESFEKLSVTLQDTCVFHEGRPCKFDRPQTRASLRTEQIRIDVDLKSGTHQATAWGCDLTKRYVEINTEYS
jgi:glutamate N-acetyltransferase/amino-acid N-acetyltransferase